MNGLGDKGKNESGRKCGAWRYRRGGSPKIEICLLTFGGEAWALVRQEPVSETRRSRSRFESVVGS